MLSQSGRGESVLSLNSEGTGPLPPCCQVWLPLPEASFIQMHQNCQAVGKWEAQVQLALQSGGNDSAGALDSFPGLDCIPVGAGGESGGLSLALCGQHLQGR